MYYWKDEPRSFKPEGNWEEERRIFGGYYNPKKISGRNNRKPSLKQLANQHGLSYELLRRRLDKGMELYTALNKPVRKTNTEIRVNGQWMRIAQAAKVIGLSQSQVYKQIYQGKINPNNHWTTDGVRMTQEVLCNLIR